MNRYCFLLRVRPELLEEYVERHRAVWPEMLSALKESGWHNYSLFLADDGLLIGYFETPHTFDECLAAMDSEPINAKWQELMAPYFDGGALADQMMRELPEVFHLP